LYEFKAAEEASAYGELGEKEAQATTNLARWNLIQTPTTPPVRARHAAFELDDNHMLIFGGVDKKKHYADTWIYSCLDESWTHVEPKGFEVRDKQGHVTVVRPGARAHFAAAKILNKIVIHGGYGGGGIVYGDLWALHVDLDASKGDKLRYASTQKHKAVLTQNNTHIDIACYIV
jgi:hypothetical protein